MDEYFGKIINSKFFEPEIEITEKIFNESIIPSEERANATQKIVTDIYNTPIYSRNDVAVSVAENALNS